MLRLTFNPGPSQVSPATKADIQRAVDERVIEISHRSKAFSEISEAAVQGLHQFLHIPDNYSVLYTSSATEAMQIAVMNLVEKKSFHFCCGGFSDLFLKVSRLLGRETMSETVEWGEKNDYAQAVIAEDSELIAVTFNETSSGVMCTNDDIASLRARYPDTLLAVDVTSIAGVKQLPIADADIWLFSVQKGFGLPAGLGILILSPQAVERAQKLIIDKRILPGYFNMPDMLKKMEDYQTLQTPNVLAIYLLAVQMKRWNEGGGLEKLEKDAREKWKMVDDFVTSSKSFSHFVRDASARSLSVICLAAESEIVTKAHDVCRQQEIILGKGYGKLKETTIRIANFPAIRHSHILELVELLTYKI